MTALFGRFAGRGTWHEANGEQDGYRVEQVIAPTAEGWRTDFTHVFDNGDPDTVAAFAFRRVTPDLYRAFAGEAEIGQAYVFGDFAHYTLKLGEMIVEASMAADGAGLRIFGSSSTNKAGNAIAWQERLERVG